MAAVKIFEWAKNAGSSKAVNQGRKLDMPFTGIIYMMIYELYVLAVITVFYWVSTV